MRCLFASKLASHGRQICSEHFNLGQPSFDAGEVELLVSAVQKTLEHLREANERLGGNDAELMEAGRL
jgi:hypothetical protein